MRFKTFNCLQYGKICHQRLPCCLTPLERTRKVSSFAECGMVYALRFALTVPSRGGVPLWQPPFDSISGGLLGQTYLLCRHLMLQKSKLMTVRRRLLCFNITQWMLPLQYNCFYFTMDYSFRVDDFTRHGWRLHTLKSIFITFYFFPNFTHLLSRLLKIISFIWSNFIHYLSSDSDSFRAAFVLNEYERLLGFKVTGSYIVRDISRSESHSRKSWS